MTSRRAETTSDTRSRLGVIDIGSNSIRLVVYDGLTRAPLPIVNRKAVVGLGTDVERLGRIGDDSFERGVAAVAALVRIAEDVPVAQLSLLATAAVREAENGAAFQAAVAVACGRTMDVLSGDDEARMSALGVISASPQASGIVGDLGGGSLELVAVENGRVLKQTSLPIGPLRLMERTAGRLEDAGQIIDEALSGVHWLNVMRESEFYAVGGGWRAIARLHMGQHDYPLQVIHGFHLQRREARDFTAMLEHLGRQTTSQIRAVSRRRAEGLPWGAVVLERVIAALQPSDIVFSAHGLREGFHFGALDEATRAEDPMLSACRDLAGQHRRFADASGDLERWLAPVTEILEAVPDRMVAAICAIADIGWLEHPEYRAEQAMLRALRMPWSVLSHPERGFLGLVLFVRYGGSASASTAETCRRLLGEDGAARAKALGKALRLAFELCAGRGSALATTLLSLDGQTLVLTLGSEAAVAAPEKIERYTTSLGRALGRPVRVESATDTPTQKKKAAG